MNKQVKTGKQPLPPMTPKTETGKDKKEQTFSPREKDKGQDNQEEIQRQKRSADEDFEEKKLTGTKNQGKDKTTDLPGKRQQEEKRTTQQEDADDDEQIEDETEFDETEDTEDEDADRNQTDPQI